ncbi:MAG: DUF427 domain-containing protein [Acidimicrobiia bacterium]|nr:DUF427 domain-containing protein [Acidimicrobiia bacterium]
MRPSRIPPGPDQESVWDYPRPPALEPVAQRIRVVLAGVTIADSIRALRVLETSHPPNYYLPPDDVDHERLHASSRRSFCEFKGVAHYWSVAAGDRVELDVAWSYPEPSVGYAALADHLAFYVAPMDECRLGDELATPQPGGFYGGWVTEAVVGPFKGVPGSMGW